MEQYPSFSTRDLLYIFFYRKWMFLTVFVVTVGVIVGLTLLIVPDYETTAKLLVETRSPSSELSITRDYRPMQSITEILHTEEQLLRSEPVLARALDKLKGEGGLIPPQPSLKQVVMKFVASLLPEAEEKDPRRAAIDYLKDNITITPIPDSNIMSVTLKGDNGTRIKKALDAITEEYISYHLEIYRSLWSEDFFREQMKITRERLESLEDSLKTFQITENAVVQENFGRMVSEEISHIQRDIIDVNERSKLQLAKVDQMRDMMDSDPEKVLVLFPSEAVTGIDLLLETRLAVEMERDELLSRFTPEHGKIQEIDLKIEAINRRITEKVSELYDLEVMECTLLEREHMALIEVLNEIEDKAQDSSEKMLFMEKIQREIDDNRQIYSNLLMKGENARISAQADQRVIAIKVVDPALVPDKPVSPNTTLNFLISPFMGILLGLGAVLVFELLDNSLKTESEIQKKLKIKTLSSIPRVSRRGR